MRSKVISFVIIICMIITAIPVETYAATGGSTKKLDFGEFTLDISNVYAIDSVSGSGGDGWTTIYFVVVPHGATVKAIKTPERFDYYLAPFNDIKFIKGNGPVHPEVDLACDYDDTIYVGMAEGSTLTLSKNNEYYFTHSWYYDSDYNIRNIGIRVFCVDDETLVQFGGSKPAKKQSTGNVLATPTKTSFVVKDINDNPSDEGVPKVLKQAYTINSSNYVQLRAIATLLKKTVAEFNISWDGQYAVIEPGKEFTGTVTGSKMNNTYDVVKSTTKFKMNGEVFSFNDSRLINGETNYIQLREFAQKLSGTASQFNVYWDERAKQAVIQPGVPYTGIKYVKPITVLEQYISDDGVLADGNYYMKIFDKFLYPVPGGQYWLELQSEVPDMPYNIKLVDNDKTRGPKYSIAYDDTYIMLPGSREGAQLQSTTSSNPHYWRINNYKSYITLRDYLNQKLLVNAFGEKSDNNTKIIGWTHEEDTLNHSKIVLYVEAVNKLMYIKNTPIKTTYKVGEGFDTTGFEVVINEGGVDKNINDKIKFYTSGTVELTQGRPFTTTGKKVVELRYEGIKYGEYTIVVEGN